MAYITQTEPVATESRNSLCCDAPINEQFSTCTDCGEHAELEGPSTSGATFAESKAPQAASPYMITEFPPAIETAKQAAAGLALVVGLLIFWGLS